MPLLVKSKIWREVLQEEFLACKKDHEDFYVSESCAVMLRIRNHLKKICDWTPV